MNARNDLVAGQIPGLVERHASEIYYGGETEHPFVPAGPQYAPGTPGYYAMYTGKLQDDGSGLSMSADDEDLAAAVRAIQRKPKDQPLCLFLGLLFPHAPYQVEEPYFSAIDRAKLPKRIRAEECEGRPLIEERIRENQALQGFSEEQWDELRATYLGMCMKIDHSFRVLCDALKEAGEYDNSAIFFLSDHGDFAGDYGIAEKAQNTFPDCLVRVPLLVKPPKGENVDPGITDGLTELVDFYATAMDYAGIAPTHSQYGRSLREVVADRTKTVRDTAFSEGGRLADERHCDEYHVSNGPQGTPKFNPYWARHFAQTDPAAHAKGMMIRTADRKYVARVSGRDELYDLARDPEELVNRIDDPAYAQDIMELRFRLMRKLVETTDVVPYDFDSRFSAEMSWAKVQKLVPPEYKDEIMEKIRKGVNIFSLQRECRERFGKPKA
jgi:arylsulfatase A-like enzyme